MPIGMPGIETEPHAKPPSVGFSFLFSPGERPSVQDIVALLKNPELGQAVQVSHCPVPEEGWVELLVNGLTFDLRGLSPAKPAALACAQHVYGFDDGECVPILEPVELAPSRHIAAGARLQPVVRALVGFAANLSLQLSAKAIVWQPAHTLMGPLYFSRVAFNWLAGGGFPALGLTALLPVEDGGVMTKGLSHFIQQEMQLEGREGEAPADSMKLAIRLVDQLVRHGKVRAPFAIAIGSETLLAEPSHSGRRVWIGRTVA